MKTIDDVIDFVLCGGQYYLPHMAIDCTIFGYHDQQLKILLIKLRGTTGWCLPGGFIRREESFSQAADRVLFERTGLENLFLYQFHAFGDSLYRRRERRVDELQQSVGEWLTIQEDNWLLGRQVALGYYALVDFERVDVQTDLLVEGYNWWDIRTLPELLYDHNDMVDKALETLRLQLYHQPIGANLLPHQFTLPEIHVLYETLLGKTLDRRNFPRKLFALGLLNKLDQQRSIGPHRSPNLFEFNKNNYQKALEEGLILVV